MKLPSADTLIASALIALALLGLLAMLIDRGKVPEIPSIPPALQAEEADANALSAERESLRRSLEAVTEEDDANARSIALSRRLGGSLGVGGLLLVLTACGPKTPPEAFPAPLAALPAVQAPPDFSPAPDACSSGGPLLPGEQALPFVGVDGIVSCRAQVVTESRLVELLHAENEATFWQGQAAHQWRYRSIDRAYCTEVAGRRWMEAEHYRAEARTQRWIGAVGIAGALFVGAALGYAAGSLP